MDSVSDITFPVDNESPQAMEQAVQNACSAIHGTLLRSRKLQSFGNAERTFTPNRPYADAFPDIISHMFERRIRFDRSGLFKYGPNLNNDLVARAQCEPPKNMEDIRARILAARRDIDEMIEEVKIHRNFFVDDDNGASSEPKKDLLAFRSEFRLAPFTPKFITYIANRAAKAGIETLPEAFPGESERPCSVRPVRRRHPRIADEDSNLNFARGIGS